MMTDKMLLLPRLAAIVALGAMSPLHAAQVNVPGGPDMVFLQVGTGTLWGRDATINKATANVGLAANGNGTAINMTSNSTSTGLGGLVCTLPGQVYVTARQRRPSSGGPIPLIVTSPANLTNGAGLTIPVTEVGWTVDASNNSIAAGTFTGGAQTIYTVPKNGGVENCLTFYYRNTAIRAGGTYTARVTYSLVSP